jgi:signal transduction histidine kinase
VKQDALENERLRESLYEQQLELELERARRVRAETVLKDLGHLIMLDDTHASFDRLVQTARPLLEFEHAMLLLPSEGALTTEFATNEAWVGSTWEVGVFFERVFAGEPAASFHVELIQEWRAWLAGRGDEVGSALHVAIDGLGTRAMLVCTHGARAKFSGEHVQRLGLLAPLASQILVSRDHQRARLAEEVARHASMAKSRLLATMSHELRTPLNTIIGYGEILLEETRELGHTHYHGDLERVLGAANDLLGMVENVLDISRIEAGKEALDRHRVGLDAFVDDLAEMGSLLAQKQGNTFVVERTPEVLGDAWLDRQKIRRVLFNLLSNASTFTSGGRVTLGVTRGPERLVFEVRDTGAGIEPERAEQLFGVFERAHDGFDAGEGSGLGLAIARKLMRLMSGDIEVSSEPGVGSTFRAWVPVLGEGGDALG